MEWILDSVDMFGSIMYYNIDSYCSIGWPEESTGTPLGPSVAVDHQFILYYLHLLLFPFLLLERDDIALPEKNKGQAAVLSG